MSACSGDCEARIVVLTGDTAVGFVEAIAAVKVMGFFGKFTRTPGSYLSPMFSSRLRSSSKMDLRDSRDLTISEGGTSCTSNSRNLCRKEDAVDEDDTFDIGDWFRLPALLTTPM